MTVKFPRAWLRLALLALLPLLAVAMVSYALSSPPGYWVLGVSSDGERVVYVEAKITRRLRDVRTAHSDGYELAVRESDREVRVRAAMTMLDSAALSFDQRLLAVGDRDGRVTIYDTASLKALRSGDVLSAPFATRYLAFSRNKEYLFVSGVNFDDKAWRYLIVDATTMTVTQEVGSDELVRSSGGRPYRVTRHPMRRGKTPSYGPGQIMEFEQGRLQPIAEAPEHPRTDYSASLRFAVDTQRRPLLLLWNRETGTSRRFTIPDSYFPLFSPNGDQLVILSASDLVTVVDPETARVVRAWNIDGERGFDVALSPEGSWMALSTLAGEIEVWNYANGTQKYKISDEANRNQLRWALAVPGAILWCVAWLAIGWREPCTGAVLRDLATVSAVAGASFFVVLLYDDYHILIWRPSAIGSLTVLNGVSALLAIWLVFGPPRWSRRLTVALASLAAVWAGPVWGWNRFELPNYPIATNGLLVVVLLALVMLLWRWFRWTIIQPSADRQAAHGSTDTATKPPVQLPLRDLLVFPVAVGMFLLVGKMVGKMAPLPDEIQWGWVEVFAVLIPLQVLLIVIAAWAALSQRGAILRWAIGISGIGLLCIAVGFPLGKLTLHWGPWVRWWIVSQATISLYVFVCLSMLRRCGWRLQKSPSS